MNERVRAGHEPPERAPLHPAPMSAIALSPNKWREKKKKSKNQKISPKQNKQ